MIEDVIGCSSDYKGVNIIERLDKLNKWQEEQKCLLQERQSKQRELLEMEQKTIYQMMGLMCGDRNVENESERMCEENNAEQNQSKEFGGAFHEIEHTQLQFPKTLEKMANASENIERSDSKVRKQSFLKRGEGIKSRFKVDPETFRIDKLPPYKYAKKRNTISRGRLLKPSVKIQEDCSNSRSKVKENALDQLDGQGKNLQHRLICGKNSFNSTPDTKSCFLTEQINPEKYDSKYKYRNHTSEEKLDSSIYSETELKKQPISWAKVLDSQNIEPVSLKQIRPNNNINETVQDDSTLSIFELLEKKCDEGPIDMDYTPIKRFLKNRICYSLQEQDEIPVGDCFKNVGLSPQVNEILNKDDDSYQENTQYMEESNLCVQIPSNVVNRGNSTKQDQQVRFADEVDNSSIYSNQSETSNLIENDLLKQQDIFKKFQEALIFTINNKPDQYNESVNNTIPSISPDPLIKELQEKTLLVKSRLEELEREIDTFKTNNKELIKAKQELQLERDQFHEEQADLLDQLKDEKIQLEIYLHDERMNIEEDKRKFEEKVRLQKSSTLSKDRKEISRLKQELEAMKVQIKQKDQDHTAAQSRMRAQVRNLDREQKQLYEEIERLNKENKKLQNENLRLNNDSNKKMLQEINRNIAKLTPKVSTSNEENYGRQTKLNNAAPPKNSTNKSVKQKPQRHVTTDMQVKVYDQIATEVSLESNENINSTNSADPSYKIPSIEGHSLIKQDSQTSISNKDMKREIVNADGSRDILYPNGNVKKVSANGLLTRMLYYNKDIKETDINQGTVRYYYAETNTWHTTYLDGLEILEFPNGQTEHRRKNGVVEIHFPNNSIKIINPLDEENLEEWRFVDGTNLIKLRNGDKVITLPNGQKEIHTKISKRREYPDGTIKLIYPDGRQETRYSNGRIRLKDKDGNLIMDSGAC